jgi:menaquinone-dependent protoporphyrinogen oxidase
MTSALVAYATKGGSTAEVAEAIAATLRKRGLSVTVTRAGRARDRVDGYDLVVLGGALYSGRWHNGAHRFLRRHRRELDGTAVAVFGMGPRRDAEEAWQKARDQLNRALGKRPWLRPMAVTVFGGVDPPKKRDRRDIRDWDAIAAWADAIADQV